MVSKGHGHHSWGNGLVPDGTKPLPQPMLVYHLWDHQEYIHWKFNQISDISIHEIVFENVVCKIWAILNKSQCVNTLAPGKWSCNVNLVIFKLMSGIDNLSISGEIVCRWIPQDLIDDKSTLVQKMAWCHQATSHYLKQCWPGSVAIWRQWCQYHPYTRLRFPVPLFGINQVIQSCCEVMWLSFSARMGSCVVEDGYFVHHPTIIITFNLVALRLRGRFRGRFRGKTSYRLVNR